MNRQLRLAVMRDFRAEVWPSMDLCADQLLAHLPAAAPDVAAADLAPPFRRLAQRLPVVGRYNVAFNADRLFNRQLLLPRVLRGQARRFDLFHVADHSYAHLVSALPAGRAGVYCHDLDAFRCLTEPAVDPRPVWFRLIARRLLAGLRKAAVVFHNSRDVGRQLVASGFVCEGRLTYAPLGVADEFTPGVHGAGGPPAGEPYLLHVGGNMQRKRLDVLLDVFAAGRPRFPGLRLIQVGGPWPGALADRIRRLGVGAAVTQLRGLTRPELARLYRGAAAVLVTSEAEGFGLPVIEALACGAAVVASDIPVLREVGGEAVVYRPVADIPGWADAVTRTLTEPGFAPSRGVRLARAALYTWSEHARVIGETYLRLAEGLLKR